MKRSHQVEDTESAYPIDAIAIEKKARSVHSLVDDTAGADTAGAEPKPQRHREPTSWDNPTMTVKAYKNADFLGSSHARSLRMMVEYEETMQRLAANGIKATVQFFGSARSKDREQYDAALAKANTKLAQTVPGSAAAEEATAAIAKLNAIEWMVPYMDKTRELARRITKWSMTSRAKLNSSSQVSGVSRTKIQSMEANLDQLGSFHDSSAGAESEKADRLPPWSPAAGGDEKKRKQYDYPPHATDAGRGTTTRGGLYVCTGGAGGFMEAANRGASDVPGGRSVGMGISLPFEKGLNPYVSDELAFEYHYFFTRKLCMAFHMQALVVAPGGFGTCDEMFEIMTLKQTGKMQRDLPIVLLGKSHWEKVINWDAFKESGTIAGRDVDELLFTDSVDEAFEYITSRLAT